MTEDEFVRAAGAPARTRATLKHRLADGEQLLGPLLRMPNEMLVELTGLVGMDFVVIDTEHGPGDQIPLGQHLTAAAAAGIPALVRVGSVGEILRVLDLGAAGVVVPHVSTVDQAEAAVRAASYPPRGERGFATYSRAGRQGLIGTADHLRRAAADTAVVVMIEDAAGVAAAEQIAGVPGVDALFVGPADLAVALGLPGEQGGRLVQEVISEVHEAARRAGAAVVSITGDAASARSQFAAGSTMVIYNALAALGALFTDLASGRANDARIAATASNGNRSTPAPLILLSGMLSTPRMWDGVIPLLDPALQVMTVRIDRDDTVAGMADSVLALAPPRFSLAGHSLGGTVALEIARRAPHRLDRLVLLDCSGRAASDTQLAAWSELAERTMSGGFEDLVAEQALANLGPAAEDAALVQAWVADAGLVGPDGLLRQLSAQRSRPDSRPTLAAITVPTLVISAERDEVSPTALQRELAAGIPGARLCTIPGAGHMSPIDSPSEVAALLSDFLG